MKLGQKPQQCAMCDWIGTTDQMRKVRKIQCMIPYNDLVCPECGGDQFQFIEEYQA